MQKIMGIRLKSEWKQQCHHSVAHSIVIWLFRQSLCKSKSKTFYILRKGDQVGRTTWPDLSSDHLLPALTLSPSPCGRLHELGVLPRGPGSPPRGSQFLQRVTALDSPILLLTAGSAKAASQIQPGNAEETQGGDPLLQRRKNTNLGPVANKIQMQI